MRPDEPHVDGSGVAACVVVEVDAGDVVATSGLDSLELAHVSTGPTIQ